MADTWSISVGLAGASYLIGSVPTGYLVARAHGVDIRQVGSGNIGATNVFRCIGKGWGILTFVLDALKGFIPAFLFPMLASRISAGAAGRDMAMLYAGLAIAGHNWPVYLRFKGGKGVATSAGGILGVAPTVAAIGLAVWVAVFVASRYVSLASIAVALVAPVASWCLYGGEEPRIFPVAMTVLGILIILRHVANIRRLLNGTEHRFSFGKKAQP